MTKKLFVMVCVMLALSLIAVSASYAAEKSDTGSKMKSFWQKIFKYPAKVTDKSADVIADTGKKGTSVVTTEVRRVGEVTSGELAKTKELVTEPLTSTAEGAVKAVKDTVAIPVEAAKDEPAASETTTQ
jgi:hypothetical protein